MSDHSFVVPQNIQALAPYKAGKPVSELARENNLNPNQIIKLASNENPLGFSPKVKQALVDYLTQSPLSDLGRYPDPNGFDLKKALSEFYQIETNCLTLGNGSNDLLELISLTFLNEHTSCVYSKHAFIVYKLSTQARGAQHIEVPATADLGIDLDGLFNAIQDNTRLVYLANPNNPTGSFHAKEAVQAFVQRVYQAYGDRVVVVLDEAYNEYLDPELRFDSAKLVQEFPNLIVLRTFSKAYGLAGLRVGYGIAHPQLTDYMNRVRQPFNVNALAQVAAVAALHDQDFLTQSYTVNKEGKAYLCQAFDDLGLSYVPSFSNFVLVKFGDKASHIAQALLTKGLIVRPVVGDGLPEHLRISIGTQAENQAFITALKEVLA